MSNLSRQLPALASLPILLTGLMVQAADIDGDSDGFIEAETYTNPDNYLNLSGSSYHSMTLYALQNSGFSENRNIYRIDGNTSTVYFRYVNSGGDGIKRFYDDANDAGNPTGDSLSNHAPGFEPPLSIAPLFGQYPKLEPNPTGKIDITAEGITTTLKEGDVLAVELSNLEPLNVAGSSASRALPTVMHLIFSELPPPCLQ